MEINDLAQQNPWWKNKDLLLEDRSLKKKDNSQIYWIPRLKYTFDLWGDVIYTIRGPRQVGKTTLVKILMKELLFDKVVEPTQVFFYACDLVSGPKELASIIESYLQYARGKTSERLFLFLDEISSVKDWQKGVKHVVDAGHLDNCTVVLTGSHNLDIRHASERLPGRRGTTADDILDKILVPMKFSEYVEAKDPKLYAKIKNLKLLKRERRVKIIHDIADVNIPQEISDLYCLFSQELNRLFQDYLLTGGIAPAVDAYTSTGKISSTLYDTYVKAMMGDVSRWQKKEVKIAQIIQYLTKSLTMPVSWQSIWKQTDFGSKNTVEDYINVLESSFTISTIYQLDRNKDTADFTKDKKIYFQDPFIFHALRNWAFSLNSPFDNANEFIANPESCSKLVESIINAHLIRLAFNLNPTSGYEYINKVFHWRSTSKKEVDFAIKLNGKYLPIEVKYQNSINHSDLQGLHQFITGGKCYRGIAITKDTLKIQENLTLIPHYIFLMIV